MNDAIRVMIVDDHAVLRSGLRLVIEREEGVEVAGEAGTAEDAIRSFERLRPTLVLMDLEMPGIGGLAGVGRFQELHPEVAVLVLSMHGEADDVRRAFEAGASGYVLKTAADEELIRAIRAVATGERYLHPSLGAVLAQPPQSRGAVDELSAREREVLRLLALGHTNQEIAQQLYVSVRTVESHRAHIMTKLRAASRAEMVRHAIEGGLLEEQTS
jgi:two-component system, NarL family, response regulator NreC